MSQFSGTGYASNPQRLGRQVGEGKMRQLNALTQMLSKVFGRIQQPNLQKQARNQQMEQAFSPQSMRLQGMPQREQGGFGQGFSLQGGGMGQGAPQQGGGFDLASILRRIRREGGQGGFKL